MATKSKTQLREFESPLPHKNKTMKAAPVAAFIFESKNSGNLMANSINYRTPRIVKEKSGWYILYSYRIPEELRPLYKNLSWKRFRVKQDMNRKKGQDREDFAQWLLAEITQSLKNGYSPFQEVFENMERVGDVVPDLVTAARAFAIFLEAWKNRGIEPLSLAKYKKYINRLAEYLQRTKVLQADIKSITSRHIEAFLKDGRTTYKFSNREYNNTYEFIRTAFNFMVKKSIIDKNPCDGIDKLKTKSTKHRFYDTKNLDEVTRTLQLSDPYLFLAAQTVYYLCIRSSKELMNLKVGGIHWGLNKILLDAEGTKGNSARYIPMDNNIKELFIKQGIDKYPDNYYVFGIKEKPSIKPISRGFFAKRFRKVRDKMGWDDRYTLYGFKATRIIHLKQDGLSDADIMSLTGHKDFAAYAGYLRDIGMAADANKINEKSRKI